MTKEAKKQSGFHSCGRWYSMGEPPKPYIETLKKLLKEIREKAFKFHYTKPLKTTK